MKKILVYVEPHPLRNSLREFMSPAQTMCGWLTGVDHEKIDWRVFSNDSILDVLKKNPDVKDKIIFPKDHEKSFIEDNLREWGPAEIVRRTELVEGVGVLCDFYEVVLERIYEFFKFDIILLWSENGAVRRFASKRDISVLHAELGPTRTPFPETIYLDCLGTNGSASFRGVNLDNYPLEKVLPTETWLSLFSAENEDKISVNELKCSPHTAGVRSGKPYVYVALQLADDLNTISHSTFSSPRQFLEYILPKVLDLGFDVVIKGHPGAPIRPSNLVEEIDALQYALSLEAERVTSLDRNIPHDQVLPIIASASAVLSINSSVSFEALLMGVPGLVLGDAAYDINSMLMNASRHFLLTGQWPLERRELDRLTTVLFRHFLHPRSNSELSKFIEKIAYGITPHMCGQEYAELLMRNICYGYSMIDEEYQKTSARIACLDALSNVVELNADFIGCVDQLRAEKSDRGLKVIASGWIWRSVGNPVNMVAIRDKNGALANITNLYERDDVRLVHTSIKHPVGFKIESFLSGLETIDLVEFVFITNDMTVTYPLRSGVMKPRRISDGRNYKSQLALSKVPGFLKGVTKRLRGLSI